MNSQNQSEESATSEVDQMKQTIIYLRKVNNQLVQKIITLQEQQNQPSNEKKPNDQPQTEETKTIKAPNHKIQQPNTPVAQTSQVDNQKAQYEQTIKQLEQKNSELQGSFIRIQKELEEQKVKFDNQKTQYEQTIKELQQKISQQEESAKRIQNQQQDQSKLVMEQNDRRIKEQIEVSYKQQLSEQTETSKQQELQLKQEISKLNEQLKNLQSEIQSKNQQNTDNQNNNQQLQQQIDILKQQQQEQAKNGEIINGNAQAQIENEFQKKQIDELKAKFTEKDNLIQQLNSQIAEYRSKEQQQQDQLSQNSKKIQNLEGDIVKLNDQIKSPQNIVQVKEVENSPIQNYKKEIETLKLKLSSSEQEILQLNKQIQDLENQMKLAKENNKSSQQNDQQLLAEQIKQLQIDLEKERKESNTFLNLNDKLRKEINLYKLEKNQQQQQQSQNIPVEQNIKTNQNGSGVFTSETSVNQQRQSQLMAHISMPNASSAPDQQQQINALQEQINKQQTIMKAKDEQIKEQQKDIRTLKEKLEAQHQ